MTISKKMMEAINRQINREFFSGYLYLSAAIFLETNNFDGMAHWMKIQAKEEFEHGMKFYGFIIERGGSVSLTGIEAPKSDWKSPLEIFQYAYDHEKKVTEMINNLIDIAKSENDNAALELLNWFIKEQVEEEANSSKIAAKLSLVGDNAGGLFIIDGELRRRE
jgi:ferritin